MRGLPESVPLLYVGTRAGVENGNDAAMLSAQLASGLRRRVVGLFWPFAFSGLVERRDLRGAVAALGRTGALPSGARRDVIGYMAQNCQHRRRDALFSSMCARLSETPVKCEAFSKCPHELGENALRNRSGVRSRRDPRGPRSPRPRLGVSG